MTGKMKILVIEDEPDVSLVMAQALARAGCEVSVAETGEQGMELGLARKFDVFVLDAYLPGINGFEICREFRQRHYTRRTPVVLVSGRCSQSDVRRGLDLGAVDFIGKPFDPNDFVTRILSQAGRSGDVAN